MSQRNTLTTLLGSRALAERFIHLTNDYFLSKGHLVAKADFLHGAHQMATFWYTNAAPQWQTFNGGNWNTLENDVRLFAARINRDLECITGTFVRLQNRCQTSFRKIFIYWILFILVDIGTRWFAKRKWKPNANFPHHLPAGSGSANVLENPVRSNHA